MRSFVKIESSRNDAITLLLTDIGKLCPSREILPSQICIFNDNREILFSRNFRIYRISDLKIFGVIYLS